METNVWSFGVAIKKEYEPRMYSYDVSIIPTGTFDVVLDFKVWGKKTMSVLCYFTTPESNFKFCLSVFRRPQDKQYMLPGCPIDFRSCATGITYIVTIEKNSKGKCFLKDVRPLLAP